MCSFSREQLEREVRSLVVERDTLVARLRESTQSFQQQLTSLNETSESSLRRIVSTVLIYYDP